MHLTSVFLIFAVSMSTVSPFSWSNIRWPPWDTSIFTDPIRTITNNVCNYFSEHPDRAQTALTKIEEVLQKTNETKQILTQTISYLNVTENRNKLSGGNITCPTFFNEIKDKLVADWKNQNINSATAQQKALGTLIDIYNSVKSLKQ